VSRRPPDPPAAVVFDCDGLLLDTESAWSRSEAVLYRRYGAQFTLEHKRELVGTAGTRADEIVERHLGLPGRGADLRAELLEIVLAEVARSAPPQPGARELVAALRAEGVPIGVASNSPSQLVELALSVAGFDGVFASVVTVDDVAHPKPAPDIYLESCRTLGADPAGAIALEDSQTGTGAALAAGMFVIGVPSLDGVTLEEAHLRAGDLHAAEVWEALGLRLAA
jgi:HAD superfamily hydrolase (TIGR01509 family)